MVRFAHMADVHLGGWKQPPMQQLNFQSFIKALDLCISEKVEFVLISGDLFDSAYPPIEILKETFGQFRKLKEAKIPCYIVAGSHDYSVSGKTFLDVLEKAGFCRNAFDFEEKDSQIILNPIIHGGVAIYGYPGKKSGLEISELRKIKLNDSPGLFKIFMLHTTLDKARGSLPIDAIESDILPKADYYALGHLHIDFQYQNFVYPGPIFPNNFQELEDLSHGSFYIVETDSKDSLKKMSLAIKQVLSFDFEIKNALTATQKIIAELEKRDIDDKILLLRIRGELDNGKTSDIRFSQIEDFAKKKGAYFVLRNIHDLKTKEIELGVEISNEGNIEEETVQAFSKENISDFNSLIPQLMNSLSIEKKEGETTESFTNRLMEESKKILKF
jgi:DNA repair protein SbcD/Mre11